MTASFVNVEVVLIFVLFDYERRKLLRISILVFPRKWLKDGFLHKMPPAVNIKLCRVVRG